MTKNLTIAIDGRPFAGPPNGFTTYLSSIIGPLQVAGMTVVLLSNRPLSGEHKIAARLQTQIFGTSSEFLWEQTALPRYLKDHHFDVYFSGANRGIPWQNIPGTAKVLGLLDIIPYKFFRQYLLTYPFGFIRRELIPQLIAIYRAELILTISKTSAGDISAYFHRTNVTPILIKLTENKGKKAIKPTKQFVYLGGNDPRKRLENLIRAFAKFSETHTDYSLCLIGRGYDPFMPLIAELGLSDKIILSGFVSEQAKSQLLAESSAVVYPSLYEGYGLAIAEAILADVPVIAGRGGSQAEVGGEAVIYIDPEKVDDIARGMEEILSPAVRKRLSQARQRQVKLLTSPTINTKIVDFFKKAAVLHQ